MMFDQSPSMKLPTAVILAILVSALVVVVISVRANHRRAALEKVNRLTALVGQAVRRGDSVEHVAAALDRAGVPNHTPVRDVHSVLEATALGVADADFVSLNVQFVFRFDRSLRLSDWTSTLSYTGI